MILFIYSISYCLSNILNFNYFILDLRKKFEREPISVAAELGETAVLQCLPPEGKPLPEVKTQKPFNEIECR